ncbi:MAG: LamG domain-containing protein, partial [Akkermansiaceae bacterium]|nr:LamG domain-containing protein [Akkermansiaceae bacterium]
SCPDFDHFGAGSVALQRMLVQEGEGGKILLLPAWPAEWDADFKLHVAGGAVVIGTVRDGKLAAWDITPAARRGDVIVHAPQPTASAFPPIPANTHPSRVGSNQNNQSLRLIVGNRRHEFREVLQAGAWQHVAVVIDRGTSRVFLDGKPLTRK